MGSNIHFRSIHQLFVILICFCSSTATAQRFQWVNHQSHNIVSNPDLTSFNTESDSQGNSFLAGIQNLKQYYGNYYGDAFVKKYDPSGNILFSKIMTGKIMIEGMQTDQSGNVYLSGNFMDTMKIDPVNFILNTGTGTNIDHFLIKLSAGGDLVWKKNIQAMYPSVDQLSAIRCKGGFLYAGMLNFSTGFIKKFDQNGNELLSIPVSHLRIISGIDIDMQGNIFSAGACGGGSTVFGDSSATANHPYNIYFVKFNSTGNCQWIRFVEDVTFQSTDIACDNAGNLYASGDLSGSFMFGNIQSQGNQWVYDFFLTKINPAGTFLWLKEVPQTQTITGDAGKAEVNSIATDAQNNVHFTGFLRGTVNWGNNIVTTSSGYTNMLILKFDPSGNIKSGKRTGSNTMNRTDDISLDNSGNIFLCGNFSGSTVFDSITVTGSGSVNSFIAKLNPVGDLNLKLIIEGFYNPEFDNMIIRDTVTVYFRNSFSPYSIIDSSVSVIDPSTFTGSFEIKNAPTGSYYIHTSHRNALETWSAAAVNYIQGSSIAYDLSADDASAFGNNLKQLSATPVRFAEYSGDANNDGMIDLNDLVIINNDVAVFASGYLDTDINGDNNIDLSDLVITYNNSKKFVSVIRP